MDFDLLQPNSVSQQNAETDIRIYWSSIKPNIRKTLNTLK